MMLRMMSKNRALALGVYLSQALLLGGCEAAEPVADDPSELYVEELVIAELEPAEAAREPLLSHRPA